MTHTTTIDEQVLAGNEQVEDLVLDIGQGDAAEPLIETECTEESTHGIGKVERNMNLLLTYSTALHACSSGIEYDTDSALKTIQFLQAVFLAYSIVQGGKDLIQQGCFCAPRDETPVNVKLISQALLAMIAMSYITAKVADKLINNGSCGNSSVSERLRNYDLDFYDSFPFCDISLPCLALASSALISMPILGSVARRIDGCIATDEARHDSPRTRAAPPEGDTVSPYSSALDCDSEVVNLDQRADL